MDAIEITGDGRAMFVGKDDAWHRLGTIKGRAFGIEDILESAPEILMPVTLMPTFVQVDGEYIETPNCGANVRADGKVVGEGLGKESFGNTQPLDLLAWGEEIARASGQVDSEVSFPLITAGLIHGGEEVFFTFDGGTTESPLGAIANHLTIAGGYGGKTPNMALHSGTIVVCANTFAAAKASAHDRTTLKHTKNIDDRMRAAISALRDQAAHQADQLALMQQLDSINVTPKKMDALYADVFGDVANMDDGRGRTIAINNIAKVKDIFRSDVCEGLPVKSGLRFVQAVNTFENWHATIRGIKGRDISEVRAERQVEALLKGKMPFTDKATDKVLALA